MKLSPIPKELLERALHLPLAQREQIVENIKRAVHEQKEQVLSEAFAKGILDTKEYEEKYKDHFYGEHGADSFIDYLTVVLGDEDACFITNNHRVVARRKELQERFGRKIISMEEFLKR